jgi:predicted small lipoprotein YifL
MKNALKIMMLVALVMVASTAGLGINVSWCEH